MDGQMKKGVLEMCILHEVAIKEIYGYEVLKIIGELFPNIDRSTVYAVLRRLNADGKTDIRVACDASGGPPRKYYRITEEGKSALKDLITEWESIRCAVEKLHIL